MSEHRKRRWPVVLCVVSVATLMALADPAPARVSVSIGINLGAAPELVPVPGTPVMYGPAVPANYFSYAGQYYVFVNGVWYVSAGYNGPWVVVAPAYVPRPILAVPLRYYRVRPRAWRHWRADAPPRWQARWGRRWRAHQEPGRAKVQRVEHRRVEHRRVERREEERREHRMERR
jgi:hypothetical protein